MTEDPGKLSNLLSIMIFIITNGRLFSCDFFFIRIIQLVPMIILNLKNKTKKFPLNDQTKFIAHSIFLVSDDKFHDAELWETSS